MMLRVGITSHTNELAANAASGMLLWLSESSDAESGTPVPPEGLGPRNRRSHRLPSWCVVGRSITSSPVDIRQRHKSQQRNHQSVGRRWLGIPRNGTKLRPRPRKPGRSSSAEAFMCRTSSSNGKGRAWPTPCSRSLVRNLQRRSAAGSPQRGQRIAAINQRNHRTLRSSPQYCQIRRDPHAALRAVLPEMKVTSCLPQSRKVHSQVEAMNNPANKPERPPRLLPQRRMPRHVDQPATGRRGKSENDARRAKMPLLNGRAKKPPGAAGRSQEEKDRREPARTPPLPSLRLAETKGQRPCPAVSFITHLTVYGP